MYILFVGMSSSEHGSECSNEKRFKTTKTIWEKDDVSLGQSTHTNETDRQREGHTHPHREGPSMASRKVTEYALKMQRDKRKAEVQNS